MTIQAQFSTIKWEVSEKKVMSITSMSYGFGIKTETKSGSGGKDKTVTKGPKPDSITVSYSVNRLCGNDPEAELSKAEKLVGTKATFILGKKRLGDAQTMLLSVKPSDVVYDAAGVMLSLSITLTFGEPDEQKGKKGKKGKKKKGKKGASNIDKKWIEQIRKSKGINN